MKKLLLIRHAKATHETGYSDFERPLKYLGLEDAGVMAARLNDHPIIPQLLISSPALRTLSTANVFAEHLSLPQPVTDKSIYEADKETLVDLINELPDEYDFIALVGHNPGISELLVYLTGQMRDMVPCAVALIEFNAMEWMSIENRSGKLTYYTSPGD
jgi:phosphohistidine phosphatase